jgi:signal transduction histidine kinase
MLQVIKRNEFKEIAIISAVCALAFGSIFYSYRLAKQIEDQEKAQVLLWANAISQKNNILKETSKIFQILRNEERKKVELTSKATQFVLSESDNDKLIFFLDIIKLNTTIPVVSTKEDLTITDFRNVVDSKLAIHSKLLRTNNPEFFKYPPIEVKSMGKKTFLFYQDSKIYQELTEIMVHSNNQFLDEIKNNSSLLPIVLTDAQGNIEYSGNLPTDANRDEKTKAKFVSNLLNNTQPIIIDIDPKNKKRLYYQHSVISSYLKWFPILLYSALALLFWIAFKAITNTRKFEKNQIWVGMSKETAHQLGTPISSLSAWLEMMTDNTNYKSDQELSILKEMKHDVGRLELIADRFSKIGSKPKLEEVNLHEVMTKNLSYMSARFSKHIDLSYKSADMDSMVRINVQLFDWVVENVTKNAIDAIDKNGFVTLVSKTEGSMVIIEFKDSGKGISRHNFEKIFEPGFTTKKRGWGLGLSLCKRIVEEYFDGRIFIKNSEINQGTTLRIELKRVV